MTTILLCIACFGAGVITGDRVRAYLMAKKNEAVTAVKDAANKL